MNRLEEIQEIIKNFIYEKQQTKQQITEIERKRTELAQKRNEKKRINENQINAYANNSGAEINELGKQISELGNQSQGLQNKLDSKYNEIKATVNSGIDNLIAEEIRKIKIIEEERQELEENIISQKEKSAKYEIQKQEFYARFGRMPELSQNAIQNVQINQKECELSKERIIEIDEQLENEKSQIQQLAKIKKEFNEGKWEENVENTVIQKIEQNEKTQPSNQKIEEIEEESITLPLTVEENIETDLVEEKIDIFEKNEQTQEIKLEEINIEEFAPIEEIRIEEFSPIDEIEIEEMQPVEEIEVQEMEPIVEINIEPIDIEKPIEIEETIEIEEHVEPQKAEEEPKVNSIREFKVFGIDDEEEELQQIWQIEEDEEIEPNVQQIEKTVETESTETVEQINEESSKKIETIEQAEKVDEIEELTKSIIEEIAEEQEIIAYEEKQEEEKTITPVFGEKVTLQSIIAKFENGDLLYKAQASNGDEIKVYPTKAITGNLLVKDKSNREELKEILINYAVAEYKALDKKVIKKIDPIVCEILVTFAKKYNYDAQNLIYNYAMSFSKNEESEIDSIPVITYNISYMEGTNLNKKEKEILSKICKNARKNEKIDIIGHITGFSKIKYIFKRAFVANNANALPEAKY